MLDPNTFSREFPLSRLTRGVPTNFCIDSQTPHGRWQVTFNTFVDEVTKVECPYIPIPVKLEDNVNSYPLVPAPNSDFLVYGTAFHLLNEKSDNKAQTYFTMAQTQLKALVNDNRKGLSLGGQNYGRLVPRAGDR